MSELYTPKDNEIFRNYFESVSYGSCGPAAIAVACRKTVAEVLRQWQAPNGKKILQGTNFKGYAPISEIVTELEAHGFCVKKMRGNKSKAFPMPSTDMAIIRIQWLQENGE